jgi:YgiT-type zinc finger domain-containing protein
MIEITKCPTCGSRRIRNVRRKVPRTFRGRPYTVPGLQFHECPACGEGVYSPEAMRKIQVHRPKARASV